MLTTSLKTTMLSVLIITAFCFSATSMAAHHSYDKRSYSHGHKSHHRHHVKHYRHHYYRPWQRVVVRHHHHNVGAWIGGAVLGAVVVSAIHDNDRDNDDEREVRVIESGSSVPTIIYRQLADGSCYRVSYDANGTEYLQNVDDQFCGSK